MTACKETACTTCVHLEVCKLSGEFLKAQTAVDDVTVHLGDRRMIKLRDIKWIPAVNLRCDHYCKKNQGGPIR